MANIKLNDPYVNFLLPSTEGNDISLDMADLGEYKLVIFSCNHCPYAQAWEDRIINIQKKYKSSGLSTIMISSNDAEEYPEDNFQKMKERHSEKKFNFWGRHRRCRDRAQQSQVHESLMLALPQRQPQKSSLDV